MNNNFHSGQLPALLVALSLATTALPALAVTTVTTVDGSLGPTQETCLQGLANAVGDGEDCRYDRLSTTAYPAAAAGVEDTGPYNQIAYYDSLATPAAFQTTDVALSRVLYTPTVGDGKIAQKITGSVSIDDNNNGFGADDLISFSLTLTSPLGGSIVRSYGSSVVDKYDSMTQTLAPIVANSATANGSGGFDYIIASDGFPTLLTFAGPGCVGAVFGSVECGHSFAAPGVVDPYFWNGASDGNGGLGTLETNYGAKTVGTVTNLACIDSKSATGVESNDCGDSQVSYAPYLGKDDSGACAVTGGCVVGGVRGAAEDVSWDNLLLKVSTNAVGNVISVSGFNVDDYRVFGVTRCGDNTAGGGTYAATCNSWTSGYFSAVRVAPTANDDGPYAANEGVALPINVLANDTAFVDDVTVTVTTLPTKGTAIVSGSPGPQAGILITYTANIGAVGDDSFIYTVLDADGVTSDTATVALAVGLGAKNDTATTTRNQSVNINVGANDTGFDNTVTVSINGGSFSAGGSAVVTAGNDEQPGGIVVTYTPVSAVNLPAYTETFSYTIDDGVQPPDTATVTVTVNNQIPDAADGTIFIDTAGATPVGQTGAYTVPGANLGDTPSVVSISVQGSRGTATVAGTTITYTVTDPTFVSGSDSLTYLITDGDGDNDSGVLTVLPNSASPTITTSYIVTGQGKASVPLEPGITLGNGTAAEHTLVVTTQATDGSCAVSPGDATGKIVYTPASDDFVGTDSCAVTLTDADGDAVIGAVNIKVTERPAVGGGGSLDLWGLLLLGAAGLRRFRRRAGGTIALLIALLGASFSAWGQASDEPAPAKERSSAAIQEIVVTARKVEENLQEVPLAITAFDSNTIETKGITSLTDVAALTPGLSFFNAFGENLPVPVIRGIAPTDIFGQNNAAVFVDGVYISGREGLNFSQLDVERIEVVKGPQSALYGRNAFSGAINYVTKAPSEEFEAKTALEVGNEGKFKLQGGMSGPILGENLRGRIGMLYDDWDGSYDNSLAPQNDIGGYRFRSFQGALLWLPAEDWEVNLSYYKSNDDIDESASVAIPTNCEDRVNDNNGTERLQNFCGKLPQIESVPGLNGGEAIPKVAQATGEDRELDRANLRVAWDLHENGTLSALTGYSKVKQSSVSDFQRSLGENSRFLYCEGAAYTPGVPNSCGANPANLNFFTGIYDREMGAETEELSQELRFTSSQDQAFRYTAGAYLYHVDEASYPGGTIATNQVLPDGGAIGFAPFDGELAVGTAIFYETFTPDGGLDPLGRKVGDDNTDGWALFTGMDFDITDRLIGRAELRYSQEAQEINNLRYNKCYTSATTSGVLGGCVYPTDVQSLTGDDKYDLREPAAVPLYGADCQFTSIEGPVRPGTPGQCSGHGTARFESVTGRIGLDFKINSDWMVYGSIAYGEKPGGLQLSSGNQILPGGDVETVVITSTFDPEELTAYELGLKGAAFDGRLTISTAVFYNDWKEIVLRQLTETNPDTGLTLEQPVGLNVNAGDADVWGFEIEANAGFTENLTGRFTLGWADAELNNASQDTFETFPTYAPDGDVSGNKLLRQPEWLVSGSLDYQHLLTEDWDWYVGADVNYQSSVYVGNDNQSWLPEHTYVNTRLGLRNGQYTLEFWTRNLFEDGNPIAAFRDIYWANNDGQYPVDNVYPDQGPRPDFDDFVPLRYTVTYPRERTVGINMQMRFGAAVR